MEINREEIHLFGIGRSKDIQSEKVQRRNESQLPQRQLGIVVH